MSQVSELAKNYIVPDSVHTKRFRIGLVKMITYLLKAHHTHSECFFFIHGRRDIVHFANPQVVLFSSSTRERPLVALAVQGGVARVRMKTPEQTGKRWKEF